MLGVKELSEAIIQNTISGDEKSKVQIFSELLKNESFYLLAKPNEDLKVWESQNPDYYIESKALIIFSAETDAKMYALARQITLPDRTAMIRELSKEQLTFLVTDCYQKKMISGIRVYATSPVYMWIPVEEFIKRSKTDATGYDYADYVIEVLNETSADSRNAMVDASIILNIHECVSKLLKENKMEPADLDMALSFSNGFTERFCEDVGSTNCEISTIKKILSFFNMGKYLYVYKPFSIEMQKEIKEIGSLDLYQFMPADKKTKEPFTYKSISRGTDQKENAYYYQVIMESEKRTLPLNVTYPFNLTKGKKYNIIGLEPIVDVEPEDPLESPASDNGLKQW